MRTPWGIATQATGDHDPEDVRLEEIHFLLEARRYDDALEAARELLATDPDHAGLHSLAGTAALWSGREGTAREHLERSVALDPTEPYPYFLLSLIWHQGREFGRSREAVERAIDLDPTDALYFVQLGWNQYRLGRRDDAREAAQQAMRLDPDEPSTAALVAALDVDSGRSDYEVADDLRTALWLDPDNHQAHYSLALSKIVVGDRDGALDSARTALRLSPSNPIYQRSLITFGMMGHVWLRFLYLPVTVLPKPGRFLVWCSRVWPMMLFALILSGFSSWPGAMAQFAVVSVVMMPGFCISCRLLLPRIERDLDMTLNLPTVLRVLRNVPWALVVSLIVALWITSVCLGIWAAIAVPSGIRASVGIVLTVAMVVRCAPVSQRTRYRIIERR